MATASSTGHRRALIAGALAWLVAAVGYVVLELLTAVVLPDYSYAEQYISVLGVPAWSPRSYLMNTAFLLQGSLFVLGAVLVVRAVGARRIGVPFVALTVIAAVGDALVGIVHGGSPLWNDGYQWLHGLGAALAIFGGNAAIVAGTEVVRRAVGAPGYRLAGTLMGVAGFVTFALLQTYTRWVVDYAPIGAVERACVYTIMLWQLVTAVLLLRRSAPS